MGLCTYWGRKNIINRGICKTKCRVFWRESHLIEIPVRVFVWLGLMVFKAKKYHDDTQWCWSLGGNEFWIRKCEGWCLVRSPLNEIAMKRWFDIVPQDRWGRREAWQRLCWESDLIAPDTLARCWWCLELGERYNTIPSNYLTPSLLIHRSGSRSCSSMNPSMIILWFFVTAFAPWRSERGVI